MGTHSNIASCKVVFQRDKWVTGMERCTGNRTSTQPWPSRCTNNSGAMYAGVPRGGVLTLPQPRPVGRGMARSASPKSLIFADTEVDPSGSMFVTHSTCTRTTTSKRKM
jgi:hypothetical protein